MASTTANVLATIGTVCWCVQLIPQIIANYRKKNTTGLPESMALLWCFCAPFFAVYFISEDSSIPIMLQPHLFGILCWIVYIQVMYYPPVQRSTKQIILRAGGFIIFWIFLEVGSVIPLRHLYLTRGVKWPLLIYGIISSIFLAAGLIPPYFELWKRQGRVIGINFVFLTVDFSGAVFSLASLAVDTSDFDILGCIIYTVCAALELGIFVSHFIWCCRFRWFGHSEAINKDPEADLAYEPTENSTSDLDTEIASVGTKKP